MGIENFQVLIFQELSKLVRPSPNRSFLVIINLLSKFIPNAANLIYKNRTLFKEKNLKKKPKTMNLSVEKIEWRKNTQLFLRVSKKQLQISQKKKKLL